MTYISEYISVLDIGPFPLAVSNSYILTIVQVFKFKKEKNNPLGLLCCLLITVQQKHMSQMLSKFNIRALIDSRSLSGELLSQLGFFSSNFITGCHTYFQQELLTFQYIFFVVMLYFIARGRNSLLFYRTFSLFHVYQRVFTFGHQCWHFPGRVSETGNL